MDTIRVNAAYGLVTGVLVGSLFLAGLSRNMDYLVLTGLTICTLLNFGHRQWLYHGWPIVLGLLCSACLVGGHGIVLAELALGTGLLTAGLWLVQRS